MKEFKVIIVEDVALEMKGTLEIFRSEIPEAQIIGTAMDETELWKLLRDDQPDLVLLDLGLGGSTTAGVDVCKQLRRRYPGAKIHGHRDFAAKACPCFDATKEYVAL